MAKQTEKTRVAILGGGISALAAAYELISQPGGTQKYDVTIYQMGWRIGGKGASGRNQKVYNRIEEHGLHVWSGFYENAFQLMQKCYPELNRVPGRDPLATVFTDPDHPDATPAFRRHRLVVCEEYIDGKWDDWKNECPINDHWPGQGHELTLWEYFVIGIDWLEELLESLFSSAGEARKHSETTKTVEVSATAKADLVDVPSWIHNLLSEVEKEVTRGKRRAGKTRGAAKSAPEGLFRRAESDLFNLAKGIVDRLSSDVHQHTVAHHQSLVWLLDRFRDWLTAHLDDVLDVPKVRRAFILVDLMLAFIRGVLKDGVLVHGTTVIDDEDLIDWIRKHGAHDISAYSTLLRGFYDYCFSYVDGDPNRPRMAAGTGLLHLTRLTMDIQGAIFFKMQAGMGDVVFTPLYLVLRNYGVKFEFFHRAMNLELTEDQSQVERIHLQVQADVKPEARERVHTLHGKSYTGEYWPLFDVGDLPCWPSEPFYDQLEKGDELKGIDLESPWANWNGVGTKTLTLGTDFDVVILGTSLEPLKDISEELKSASSSWRDMLENIKTTVTVGVQIWTKDDWSELGWTGDTPLLTGYAQTIQTWGDFSQVLPQESWPRPIAPRAVSYLCGNLPVPEDVPDYSDHQFPDREHERLKSLAWQWFTDNTAPVWPKVHTPLNPTSLDWDRLTDPHDGHGRERFDAQFFRVNVSPSERYVLSLPGDYQYRMKKGRTPFANVYVAGDYTFTGILGSIESSVMSGMMASRAISGYPQKIVGEVET